MLQTLPDLKKQTWDESLNKMIHVQYCTKHVATGYALYYLLFVQTPQLPICYIISLGDPIHSVIFQVLSQYRVFVDWSALS